MTEQPPSRGVDMRCMGCLAPKTSAYLLCDACIEKSERTSHRLDGHIAQAIEGCPACIAAGAR